MKRGYRILNKQMAGILITEQLEIPEDQLEWSFARSSGPGGQNVNKVNSKATLRWRRKLGTLSGAAWMRFKKNAKRYLTSDDEIVIQSQEHRDQSQNVNACREKLRSLVLASLKPPKPRVATKPTAGSRRRRLDNKRKLGDKKRSRSNQDFWRTAIGLPEPPRILKLHLVSNPAALARQNRDGLVPR